jgi:hypothetical protein
MDVTSVSQRLARMAVTGVGLAAGLVFALPVKTGSVACPPAHEGRAYCLVQHAWAPAAMKVVGALFVAFLVCEIVLVRLPGALRRMRGGERLVRRATDHGRAAVLADPVLAAANWGILPESGREVAWTPRPVVARTGLRALTLAERTERPAGPVDRHLRILGGEETRTRRLRRGSDPALVVSCWSDATAARELDSELAVTTT